MSNLNRGDRVTVIGIGTGVVDTSVLKDGTVKVNIDGDGSEFGYFKLVRLVREVPKLPNTVGTVIRASAGPTLKKFIFMLISEQGEHRWVATDGNILTPQRMVELGYNETFTVLFNPEL